MKFSAELMPNPVYPRQRRRRRSKFGASEEEVTPKVQTTRVSDGRQVRQNTITPTSVLLVARKDMGGANVQKGHSTGAGAKDTK